MVKLLYNQVKGAFWGLKIYMNNTIDFDNFITKRKEEDKFLQDILNEEIDKELMADLGLEPDIDLQAALKSKTGISEGKLIDRYNENEAHKLDTSISAMQEIAKDSSITTPLSKDIIATSKEKAKMLLDGLKKQ